jgi:hypothetical protein
MGSKSRNPSINGYQEKRRELLDTVKTLIALDVALGCLEGQCTYFLVVKPGRKHALISKYARCA